MEPSEPSAIVWIDADKCVVTPEGFVGALIRYKEGDVVMIKRLIGKGRKKDHQEARFAVDQEGRHGFFRGFRLDDDGNVQFGDDIASIALLPE